MPRLTAGRVAGAHARSTCCTFLGFVQVRPLLGEGADHDVVAVLIAKRKLSGSCGGVHLDLLL
jgi:hypothetical protein